MKETKNMKYLRYITALILGATLGVYYFPEISFLTLVITFLLVIPLAVFIYLIVGLRHYLKDREYEREHGIVVYLKSELSQYRI